MKKILLLVWILFFLFFETSFAQSTIKGVITDQNQDPLSGAAITVKGTGTGTATNLQGAFTLNAAPMQFLSSLTLVIQPKKFLWEAGLLFLNL